MDYVKYATELCDKYLDSNRKKENWEKDLESIKLAEEAKLKLLHEEALDSIRNNLMLFDNYTNKLLRCELRVLYSQDGARLEKYYSPNYKDPFLELTYSIINQKIVYHLSFEMHGNTEGKVFPSIEGAMRLVAEICSGKPYPSLYQSCYGKSLKFDRTEDNCSGCYTGKKIEFSERCNICDGWKIGSSREEFEENKDVRI